MKTKYEGMHENHLEPNCTQMIHSTNVIIVSMGLHVSKTSHFFNSLKRTYPFLIFLL